MNCFGTHFQTVCENFSIKAECNFFFIIFVNHLNTMVKIKKSVIDVKKSNAYLSLVYTSPSILAAFQDWISCTEKRKKNFQTFLEKMCNYGQKTTCRMLYTDL